MTTKRQQRAALRIERARDRKWQNFRGFVLKAAARRLKNPEDARYLSSSGFCCPPNSLEMNREELLSKGQQLCGGAAVLFDREELFKLLPSWDCRYRRRPVVLLAASVRSQFHEDGSRRDTHSGSFSSGGSISDWA